MKKMFVFGTCFAFLAVMSQLVGAQQWPAGQWKTAVIFTDDAVHQANGGATIVGNKFTIKAGGNDIWGKADQFTYVYKEVSGDFDVQATVIDLEKTDDWSKAGIMARQELSPGSKNVLVACRGLNDLVTFQRREKTDDASASERVTPKDAPRPVTIRLTRKGDEFMGGWSLDGGKTWKPNVTKDGVTPTPPAIVQMQDPIFIGIAVTSHAAGVIATAVVEVIGDVVTSIEKGKNLSVTWGKIKINQ